MSKNKEPRPRRTFTPELKQQIVDLYRGGKQIHSLINGLPRLITVVPLRKKITVLQKMQR